MMNCSDASSPSDEFRSHRINFNVVIAPGSKDCGPPSIRPLNAAGFRGSGNVLVSGFRDGESSSTGNSAVWSAVSGANRRPIRNRVGLMFNQGINC